MILVTGASRGIGFECAKDLLKRTAHRVLITGRSKHNLESARLSLPPVFRRRLVTRACDQSDADDVEDLCKTIREMDEPLDGAILSVGFNPVHTEGPRRLHALDSDTVEYAIRTNCTHTLLLSGCVLGHFRRRRTGTLIWIGSQGWRHGPPGAGVYCASKAFLSGLALVAGTEYGDRGIRVHLLHPGLVLTDRTRSIVDDFASRHDVPVDSAEDVARRIVDVLLTGDEKAVEVDL